MVFFGVSMVFSNDFVGFWEPTEALLARAARLLGEPAGRDS